MAAHNDNAAYENKKAVWVATVIMGVVTILEVAVALSWPEAWGRGVLNLLFILMSAVKAVFIVGEFMHLRYEMRAMMISILAPCLFLVWFLIAFMMEGQSWLALREFWN